MEVEDDELFSGELRQDRSGLPPDDPEGRVRLEKMIKKSEVQYTEGIEDILQDHLDKKESRWKSLIQLALGKFGRLWTNGPPRLERSTPIWSTIRKAFKPTKFKGLPADCRVVPCKGVLYGETRLQ